MPRGKINPLTGITDGKLRTQIKSNLRPIWRNTTRKVFINSVREHRINEKTGKNAYHVQCKDCGRWMMQTGKERRVKKDGGLEKKAKSLYEVDHVNGITPLTDISETIGQHYHDMMYGKMEIVCVACHKARTAVQAEARNTKKTDENQTEMF